MRIPLRHDGRLMPQQVLHLVDVHACLNKSCSKGVPIPLALCVRDRRGPISARVVGISCHQKARILTERDFRSRFVMSECIAPLP